MSTLERLTRESQNARNAVLIGKLRRTGEYFADGPSVIWGNNRAAHAADIVILQLRSIVEIPGGIYCFFSLGKINLKSDPRGFESA